MRPIKTKFFAGICWFIFYFYSFYVYYRRFCLNEISVSNRRSFLFLPATKSAYIILVRYILYIIYYKLDRVENPFKSFHSKRQTDIFEYNKKSMIYISILGCLYCLIYTFLSHLWILIYLATLWIIYNKTA